MSVARTLSAVFMGFLLLPFTQTASAQRVECNLEQTLPGLLTGTCSGMAAESAIALQPIPGSSTDWAGAITLGNNPGLIEIVSTQYAAENRYVLRSTIDWFNVSEFSPTAATMRLTFDRSDVAPPTATDVVILGRARDLLESAAVWDRADDRNCGNDEPGVIGLYCALIVATGESMGKYYHRQPALQRVRRVIEEEWSQRTNGHRLEDFNNHPDTTLDEIIDVLRKAEHLIEGGMVR